MQPRHRQLLTDDLLAHAMALWGGDPAQARFLGEVVNVVYEVPCETEPMIVRITHSHHRSRAQVQAEIDWIEHLASHGMSVCRARLSCSGQRIETMPVEAGEFHVCAFERAPGKAAKRADLHRGHMVDLGRMLAAMHTFSRGFPTAGRPAWHFGRHWLINVLQSHDPALGDALHEIYEELESLPSDHSCFGMVHNDVHVGNYHLHGGNIWLFDFDNAGPHWHACDIGSAWYFALARTSGSDMDIWRQVRGPMIKAILDGYSRARPLDEYWVQVLPLFCRYRALCAYAYLFNKHRRDGAPRRRRQLALLRAYAAEPVASLDAELC